MTKRFISLALALLLLLSAAPAALSEGGETNLEELIAGMFPVDMYVYTDNGGKLNVRSEPRIKDDNVIGMLEYGEKVRVLSPVIGTADWMAIEYAKAQDGVAYVASRYLVLEQPGDVQKRAEEAERKKNLEEMNKQLETEKEVSRPFMVAVRATRTTGWINFRVGPGIAGDRIASLPDGRELKVIGETEKWYKAVDQETGKTGYISKSFVTVLSTPAEPEKPEKEQLGKLDVNGKFTIQCQLPEGYALQVVNTKGSRIVASVLSQDKEKPQLYLSIAYDELYSDVKRMNDLSDEALKPLEASFTQMNDVEISYAETAYGTKLLIAKEVGDDTDFVDILSVYEGYFVEFNMTPNPEAENQQLTDAQIQMCIDFLSEVDFVPAA